MSNLTTDQMAEIIIRSMRETALEFARKRRKNQQKGKLAISPGRRVKAAAAQTRKTQRGR
jgi:hypothetical protein